MKYRGKGGKIYNLENSPFAQGGEGRIFYVVGKPNIVAKLYKDGRNTAEKEHKLTTMVDNPPGAEVMQQITWPLDVLYDSSNTFVGFLMPKLAINEDLNVIYEYGPSAKYSHVTWGNKIIIAKNLCAVLHAVHKAGHVVGDLNPKNISVDPQTGHIIFVDTDSYHINDNGTVYRCNVGMPEYLPVEIQKKMKAGLSTAPLPTFTQESDNFALAIHIFQLLMNGTHPFACRVLPSQASVAFPQPTDNILNGDCPFINPKSGTAIPLFSPPLSILPKEMQDLFKRAFIAGHTSPAQRPSAEEWYNALTKLERQLKKCSQVSHHEYLNSLRKCPWCEADQRYTQGINAAATTLKQSTIKNTMTPVTVRAPSASSIGSSYANNAGKTGAKSQKGTYATAYSGGYSSNTTSYNSSGRSATYKSYDKFKILPFIYMVLAIISMALVFVIVEWAVLVLGVIETILFLILFNPYRKLSGYRDEFSFIEIGILALMGIAMLIVFYIYIDHIVVKFTTLRSLVEQNKATVAYYEAALYDVKLVYIPTAVVLTLAMIVGCIIGGRLMASMVAPLAILSGISVWFMIVNAILDMPSGIEDIYEVSGILGGIFAGVVLAIPSLFVSSIIWIISHKAK